MIAAQSDRAVSAVACTGNQGADCTATRLAEDYASALAIDGAGKTAALALQEAGLVLVDLSAPTALRPVALAGNPRIRALAFDGKGGRLAVGTVDGALDLVAADGAVSELAKQDGAVTALAWNPSAPQLAAACDGFAICVWDLAPGQAAKRVAKLIGHANTIAAIAWSSDGERIVSADIDGAVNAWTLAPSDPPVFTLESAGDPPLTDIALSADGRLLAAGTGAGTVAVWDRQSGGLAKMLSAAGMGEIHALRWHPDKPWIAAADETGRIVVWTWPDGAVIADRNVGEGAVEAIRWLPDGNALVTGTIGGTVRLWPLGGAPVDFNAVHPEAVLGLALVPGKDRLLSTDSNGNLWLWDLKTRDRIAMDWAPADKAVDILAIDHGGRRALTAGNGGLLYLYTLDEPGAPQRIDLGSTQIEGAAWSPDDRMIAAVDNDGMLKVWSLADDALSVSVRLRGPEPPAADTGTGPFGQLHRMVWLPDRQAIAIATSSGKVVVATLDPAAWIARARAVFAAGPATQAAPAKP